MSTIRQGQGPFSGQVPPAGDALFFQEEFQSGDNAVPFSPLAGPGTQPMPLRWVEWNPNTRDLTRWLDVRQQRAAMVVGVPADDPAFYGWAGSVCQLPPIPSLPFVVNPEDPQIALAFLDVYAGLGIGPTFGGFEGGFNADGRAALIVSNDDLIANPAGSFVALGLQQLWTPPAWECFAEFVEWFDSFTGPSIVAGSKDVRTTGALFRLFLQILRLEDPPASGIYSYTTVAVASVSTDAGASWTGLGERVLKGGAVGPRTIGVAATGRNDALANITNGMTGNFDSVRVYVRDASEVFSSPDQARLNLLGVLPDGGRNWP